MGNEQSLPDHMRNHSTPRNRPSNSNTPRQQRSNTNSNTPRRTTTIIPPDPYVFFGIEPDCTEEQAKRAYYRKTKDYHPDRGGDIQLFNWIHQAYIKILHEIQERGRRVDEHAVRRQQYQQNLQSQENLATASRVMQQVYSQPPETQPTREPRREPTREPEYEPEYQSNSKQYQPPPKPVGPEPKFQADKFNKIFEETRMTRQSDRGYGNTEEFDRIMANLPQQPSMDSQSKLSGQGLNNFLNEFSEHKKATNQYHQQQNPEHQRRKEIARYRGPEALVSSSFSNCELLGEDVDDFTASMQSRMGYTDYQGAYTRYNQLEENLEELERRPKNLQTYKAERENIRFNLTAEEEAQIAAVKAYEEEAEKERINRLMEQDRLAELQAEKAKKFYLQGRSRS